jgi:para-aminobenzoate synthetase/4-amino-4-deoxychorismate lyase
MREPYDERRSRRPDVDDVVMVNTRGELTEVTRATLALELDGRWWTPPVASGCLPGVERARLLDRGVLCERVLRWEDLYRAARLAVISSLRGWRAAELREQSPAGSVAAERPVLLVADQLAPGSRGRSAVSVLAAPGHESSPVAGPGRGGLDPVASA